MVLPGGLWASNNVVGDPEWIGELERPGYPHSGTNHFLSRYAYMVVPAGKTLDLNYIHNATRASQRRRMNANGTDFSRNQGVGSWEINLASFLYDLNTNNVHGWGFGNVGYIYNPLTGVAIQGNAFYDAAALFRYRVNGNPNVVSYTPASINQLYPNNGNAGRVFQNDFVDGYSDDPFLFSTNGVGKPWRASHRADDAHRQDDFH